MGDLWTVRTDGDDIYVRSVEPLNPYPRTLVERLVHWAETTPDNVFLARRDATGDWATITFVQALTSARSIAGNLIGRGLSADRPVMILSGNSLEHGLLALGCLYAGIPWCPVSPSYSQSRGDLSKLGHVLALMTPGLVFVEDAVTFARALVKVATDVEIVDVRGGTGTTPFADLLADMPESGVASDAALAAVGPDTIAKFLLTSGSTGLPKAVINTHRMLTSNQQMILQTTPSLGRRPPVIVDWLPWNHTFGGNKIFGIVLFNGGTLYIDDGKPVAGLFDQTLANLREISPTIYFNVPVGFEMILARLEEDPDLRRAVFAEMDFMYYAGAGLRPEAILRLEALAAEETGRTISMLSGLGSTETAPYALLLSDEMKPGSDIGMPVPGIELKLAAVEGKLEGRLRGPNITPGYWRNPEQTAAAFDDAGFYRLGDALQFVDPENPSRGLLFDGRIAEDFKLSSGTWVSAGPLRAALLAELKPLAWDLVIAGLNRSDVRILIFPDFAALRALAGDLPDADLVHHPAVHGALARGLASVGTQAGASGRVSAALLLTEPPSLDAGELTDKGSISQRGVLAARAVDVDRLYDPSGGEDIIQVATAPKP